MAPHTPEIATSVANPMPMARTSWYGRKRFGVVAEGVSAGACVAVLMTRRDRSKQRQEALEAVDGGGVDAGSAQACGGGPAQP